MSLAYSDSGQGLPLVLLHGFCESKSLWNHFLPNLSQKFRVIAIDLPGFGESKSVQLPEIASMEWLAEQVKSLLDELRITHAVMIGHSLGGYVTLAFAKLFPEALLGLGLFHSTAFADTEEKQANRNKTIIYVENYGVEAFIRPFVGNLFWHTNRERCKSAIELLLNDGLNTPQQSIISVQKGMRDRADSAELIAEIDIPVLIIAGKNDGSVNFADSLKMSGLPKFCTAHFMHFTGHAGMFEREKETLKYVSDFCEGILS